MFVSMFTMTNLALTILQYGKPLMAGQAGLILSRRNSPGVLLISIMPSARILGSLWVIPGMATLKYNAPAIRG
jgi:hypothetical protein